MGKERKSEFRADPFYLYPIKEDLIDRLFVNREEEISVARGLMGMQLGEPHEICAVVGGIG